MLSSHQTLFLTTNSHQCRTRHLKCDGQLPCGHCRKGVRRCTKEDEHIFLNESQKGIVRRRQRYDLTFTGGQRWMDLPTSGKLVRASGGVLHTYARCFGMGHMRRMQDAEGSFLWVDVGVLITHCSDLRG